MSIEPAIANAVSEPVPIKFRSENGLSSKTYYYKEETFVSGTPGNYEFNTSILRSEDKSFDITTIIGTRGVVGTINLDDDFANDDEKRLITNLRTGLKSSSEDLKTQIINNADLKLNAKDKQTLNKNLGLSTAEGDNGGGNGTPITLPEGVFEGDIGANISFKRKARTTYGDYCYPEDIKNDRTQDRIKFTMKFSKGSRVTTSIDSGVKIFERRQFSIGGSVTLPIQSGIQDQNSVKWNGGTLNALQAFGASAAINVFNAAGGNKPIEDTVTQLGLIANEARSALQGAAGDDTRTAINVYLAQQAVGAQNLLSRTAGAIINPNIEMLFDAPALRPFSFQFKMSPRDEDEAAQVRSIISFFKQGMSVKTSSSNIFLKAPNIFDIRYITFNRGEDGVEREVDHPSINRIKTCALLAASVDYTPDGSYMTYDDPRRSMTSYGLTLSFNELDPIYEDDYIDDLGMKNSDNTANEIGF